MAEVIAHIIYKNGMTVGFCLESDPARAQVYGEVAYRPGPDEWITVAGLTLADGLAELERSVKSLESLRPHWAMGYTSDSMAAQASTAALAQLWELLGATNQSEAVERVTILQGIAKAPDNAMVERVAKALWEHSGSDWTWDEAVTSSQCKAAVEFTRDDARLAVNAAFEVSHG